jgi:origin recognition complex subunit 4
MAPHDIVAWMKGDGAAGLGPEMVGWGRLMGGHA